MPRSSSSLTSEASLKRGGGSVKCCSGLSASRRRRLALFERRQLVLERLVFLVLGVLGFFVDLEEAFELQHRSGDAEVVACGALRCQPQPWDAGVDIDRGLVEDGGGHLAGDEALPDELVNLELIVLQVGLHLVRSAQDGAGTDGFVSVLRVLRLGLVDVGLLGQKGCAEVALDQVADLGERVVGDADRVGTHVGDEADRAFGAEFDAFIEALGDHHGALDGHAELARGVLLELGGGERRHRIAAALGAS